jgi:hypothetical protein
MMQRMKPLARMCAVFVGVTFAMSCGQSDSTPTNPNNSGSNTNSGGNSSGNTGGSTGGNTGGSTGGSSGTTAYPDFTTPDTHFIDSQEGTLQACSTSYTSCGYWYSSFTLGGARTMVARFAADGVADAGAGPPSDLSLFTGDQNTKSDVTGFEDSFGTHYANFAAGNFYVGARAQQSTAPVHFRLELDYDINLAPEKGYRFAFVDNYLGAAKNVVANGGYVSQQFAVQTGYRYFLDGCNSGNVDTYVLPVGELTNFTSGSTFQYYTAYYSGDSSGPGLWEIKLPAGTYVLAFRNHGAQTAGVVYSMERWQIIKQ